MIYNMSKAYVQIRSRFSVRAKRKCINFSQITVATTAVDRMAHFKLPSILTKPKRC